MTCQKAAQSWIFSTLEELSAPQSSTLTFLPASISEVLEAHLQPSEVIKIATRCKSVQTPDVDTFVAVISNVQNDHDAEQAALLSVEGGTLFRGLYHMRHTKSRLGVLL